MSKVSESYDMCAGVAKIIREVALLMGEFKYPVIVDINSVILAASGYSHVRMLSCRLE